MSSCSSTLAPSSFPLSSAGWMVLKALEKSQIQPSQCSLLPPGESWISAVDRGWHPPIQTRLVGELQGVKRWAHQRVKVVQDERLYGLQEVGSQGYRSVMVGLPEACDFWHWNHTGGLPQFRNPLQMPTQVKDILGHLTELICTVLSSLKLIPSGPVAFLIFVFS